MEVCQEYYGLPPPPGAFGPFLRLNPGDIVELTKAEAEQNWWEVQAETVGGMGVGDLGKWGHGPAGLWQGKAGLEEAPGEGGIDGDYWG